MQPQPTPKRQPRNAILLHACCGPCSIMPVIRLRELGWEPTLYFHNPNIHPLTEYLRRRQGVLDVGKRLNAPVILADSPEHGGDPEAAHPRPWIEAMAALGPGMTDMALRCPLCYDLRLSNASRTARALGFSTYSSSLLYSRYQNRQAILDSGASHAGEDLAFLGEDFRPWLLDGVRLSREWGIYRQQYCGCLLGEYDRYRRELEAPACGQAPDPAAVS